ncbi:MAG: hypothetical protein SGI72_18495 [Planctomycetota bacterium]|nr:hypothetical protein [Planctomycetota bacterium]
MKRALAKARSSLADRLAVDGVLLAPDPRTRVRRSVTEMESLALDLMEFAREHPGKRGEQIAAGLGTDVGTMQQPLKRLIADGSVRTEGRRRGMTHFPM